MYYKKHFEEFDSRHTVAVVTQSVITVLLFSALGQQTHLLRSYDYIIHPISVPYTHLFMRLFPSKFENVTRSEKCVNL